MAKNLGHLGNCFVLANACFAKRPEITTEANRRINEVGVILARDLGITIKEAIKLPDSQELTPNAERALDEMNAWLSTPGL